MKPSESQRGQQWLSNFLENERAIAALLLDSLELVGQDDFRNGLQNLVSDLASSILKPIALVPVRELAPTQTYYGQSRNAKPKLLLSESFPGSEAIVANIAGGLRRQAKNSGPFVASPSLANLRAARCRSILFLDDFSGSGDRIASFYKKFRDHGTIRSWESYGLLSYHVAAFAMTRAAYNRLTRLFGQDHVHLVKFCPTFENQNWGAADQFAIEELCRNYAQNDELALGYGRSRSLLAFSHTAPNNLPNILWQPGYYSWRSFFNEKAVPPDLLPLFGQLGGVERIKSALEQLGQIRLSQGSWEGISTEQLQTVLLVLAAVSTKPRNETVVTELTGLFSHVVRQTLTFCRTLSLIADNSLRLTDSGRSELARAKNVVLPPRKLTLHGSNDPYYPRSLRVGR